MEPFGRTASRIRPALASYCFNKASSGVAEGNFCCRIDLKGDLANIGGMGLDELGRCTGDDKPGAIVAKCLVAHRGVRSRRVYGCICLELCCKIEGARRMGWGLLGKVAKTSGMHGRIFPGPRVIKHPVAVNLAIAKNGLR